MSPNRQSTVVRGTSVPVAILVAIGLLACQNGAFAASVSLNADDAPGTTSFNLAGLWSDGNAPGVGNDYTVTHVLRTPDNYNSGFVFQGDTLSINAGGTLALKPNTGSPSITVNNLTLAGGQISLYSDRPTTLLGGITLASNSSVSVNGTNRKLTISAPITGPGRLAVTGSSGGLLTLTSANDYTGGTVIANGVGGIKITDPAALGSGIVTLQKNGTNAGALELALTGTNTISNTFAGMNSSNSFVNGGKPNIINTSGDNTITSNLTVTNTGGNGFNIAVNGGSLDLQGTLGSTVGAGGRLLSFGGTGTGGLVSGIIQNGSAGQAVALNKDDAGTWTFTGANTYSGTTTVNGGTLIADVSNTQNGLGTGAASVSAGTILRLNDISTGAGVSTNINNTITGAGELNLQFAAGNNARNTYMPNVTGVTGTIHLSTLGTTRDKWNAANLGTIAGDLVIDSGTQLYVSGGNTSFTNGITLQGTGNNENRGAIRLGGTVGGNLILLGDTTIGTEGGTLTGNITSGAAGTQTLTLGTTSSTGNATLSGSISDGIGAIALTKTSGGMLSLTGANTYSGDTTISGGTLRVISGNNRLPTDGTVRLAADGVTLNIAGISQTIGNLTIGSSITGNVTGTGTLIITGGSDLEVIDPSAASAPSTVLDMRNLNTFVYNNPGNTITVGGTGNTSAPRRGDLYLADTSTLTAATINIQDETGFATANNPFRGRIFMGTDTTINANTINIGTSARDNGELEFLSGVTNPTLKIRGTGGTDADRADINIGNRGSSFGATTYGLLDLTTGVTGISTLDAMAGTINIASESYNDNPGDVLNGDFLMGAGTLDVLTINLGRKTGAAATSDATVNATFTQGGGTVKVQNMVMGDRVIASAIADLNATYNLNGGGTLQAQSITAGANAANRTINWNNGTIANYDAATNLTIGAGVDVVLATGSTHAFNIGTGRTGNVAATISGSGGTLTKNSAGTLILSGDNTYANGTQINDGILRITSNTALGTTAGNTRVKGNSSNDGILELAGGITVTGEELIVEARQTGTINVPHLRNQSGNNEWAGPITMTTGGSTYTLESAAGLLTISGDISAGNLTGPRILQLDGAANGLISGDVLTSTASTTTPSLVKKGTGTWTLSGTNTYTGTTTINGGTLALQGGNAIADAGAVVLANATGAVLLLNNSETIGSLAGGGNLGGNVNLQGFTLTTGGDDSDTTYAGIISGSGQLIKKGINGTMTLSGANTFTGTVNVNEGIVRISDSSALGVGPKTVLINNGTAGHPQLLLDGSGGNLDLAANLSFQTSNANNQSITNEAGDNVVRGNITLTAGGGDTRIGVDAGTLTLTGNIQANTSGRNLRLEGAADGFVSGTIANGTNTVGLRKEGTGTWTLTGNNTYTGTTTINAGTLQIGNGGNTGRLGNNSNTFINTGATLRIDLQTLTFGYDYTGTLSGSGTVDVPTGARFNFKTAQGAANTGNLSFNVDGRLTLATDGITAHLGELTGSGVVARGGPVGSNSETVVIGGKNTDTVFSGDIGAELNVTKVGTGTLTLTGSNSTTGATAVSTGTLALGDGTATGSINNSSGIAVAANAVLKLNPGTNHSVTPVISGAGSIVKNAGSTTTLSNASGFSGTYAVNAGTLAVASGNMGTPSSIHIQSNATFDTLTSQFAPGAAVTVSGNGTLETNGNGVAWNGNLTFSPGGSPGTLNINGPVDWSTAVTPGGTYDWQVYDANTGAGTGYDLINITGTLDMTGGSGTINGIGLSGLPNVAGLPLNVDMEPGAQTLFEIIRTSAGVIGFGSFSPAFVNSMNHRGFFKLLLGNGGNSVYLLWEATPEPGTWVLFGLLGCAVAFGVRRRRLIRT